MSSPRKFSEKIALHNKKQAEETAAFEAVLREVSATTRAALEKQQQQQPRHLQQQQQQQQQHLTQPNMLVYRGGSLPNVNQMTSGNSIDLQNALHCLEDMKQGCGRQSLIDKFHRDRNRQSHSSQSQRRQFPLEKRADCSPYGLTYLSPPPDTSWRRTNSDSAIHSSSLSPSQSPQHQKTPPSPSSPVKTHADLSSSGDPLKGSDIWSMENLPHCHTRSHDMSGISIYPTPVNDSGIRLPASTNTDSLPDLTNLPFTSSMGGKLLDGSDQSFMSTNHTNNMAIGGQHAGHIGPVRTNQQNSTGARHRQSHTGPTPLVLYGSSPSHSNVHSILPQDSSLEASMSRVELNSLPCCRPNYDQNSCHSPSQPTSSLVSHDSQDYRDALQCRLPKITVSEVTTGGVVHHSCLDFDSDMCYPCDDFNRNHLQQNCNSGSSLSSSLGYCEMKDATKNNCPQYHPSNMLTSQLRSASEQNSDYSHLCNYQPCSYSDITHPGCADTQYRSSTECPQSPTSPLSQHSYSPAESPGLPNCSLSSSPFTDIYTLQQQQQTSAQANILQQQFEQFTMLQDSPLPLSNNDNSMGLYNLLLQHQQRPVGMGLNFGNMSSASGKTPSMDFNPQLQQLMPNVYYQQMSTTPSPYSSNQDTSTSLCHLPSSPNRSHYTSSKSSNQTKAGNKIPDIILTGVDDSLGHEERFAKGMLSGFTECFDAELFSIDEALKVGLNPLELEELQMLTNPNVVTDPATEDSFRLDQL